MRMVIKWVVQLISEAIGLIACVLHLVNISMTTYLQKIKVLADGLLNVLVTPKIAIEDLT
jgi:hypothetical protein